MLKEAKLPNDFIKDYNNITLEEMEEIDNKLFNKIYYYLGSEEQRFLCGLIKEQEDHIKYINKNKKLHKLDKLLYDLHDLHWHEGSRVYDIIELLEEYRGVVQEE